MKYLDKMIKTAFLIGALILSMTLPSNAQSAGKKDKLVSVRIKITDAAGKPVPGASITIGEGRIHAESDQNGDFAFKGSPDDFVTVKAIGFSKSVSIVEDLVNNNTIELAAAKLYATDDDVIPMPFGEYKRRYLTGGASVIKPNALERYPSTDLRNAFAGLGAGLEVVERDGSPGLNAEEDLGNYRVTEKIGMYTRGRSPIFVIDDIPTDITEMPLDPQEIESVTLIKDIVGKAMLGPRGADGILYIKTRRGRANERVLNVNYEEGMSVVDRFPGWVSGTDFAKMNNQARANSGLTPIYSEKAIAGYAKNDPYDKYYPNVDFRSMMLKNSMAFRRANLSSSGGSDNVQYYAYLGYAGEGDIYKIGKASDYNRINVRSNIDAKINPLIKVKFDFFAGMSLRRSPNYGYNSNFTNEDASVNTALDIVEMNSVLNDITTIPAISFPVYANYDEASGLPWYGVSSNYRVNPIGNLVDNGYYTETGRTGASNLTLDYNMKEVLSGLKSKTYVGFNIFNSIRLGKAEDYIAYIANPGLTAAGKDTIRLSKVHDGTDMDGMAKLHDYYSQRFVVFQNFSYEKAWGDHDVQTGITYYLGKSTRNGIEEPQRQQSVVWTGNYSYRNKYSLQAVLNYSGTSSFDKGKRYAMFPSVGLGWILSEENFLKDVKGIDFLKLRGEAGMLGYESFLAPFYYLDRWSSNSSGTLFGPYSTGQWFGNNTDNTVYRNAPQRIGNPNITWEKRKEFSVGVEGLFLDQKLSVEIDYFNNTRDGIISQLANTLPYVSGATGARPWFNYNILRYYGIESRVQYSDKIGKLRYSVGGNATFQNSKIIKFDEPAYRFSYQSRIGQPTDGYWGQTYVGKFKDAAEAREVPQIYDEVLGTGDLKYRDSNGDGIVDDNDQRLVGNTSPRLVYALNLKLNYSNFELYVLGNGRAFYDLPLTNKYFWNGWGDGNYSNFTRDNAGIDYPRQTYNKVNNNYVASDFWLTKGDFFKIQNVELAYNLPVTGGNLISARGVRFFVRGSNLLTLSKVKGVDPESLNSGITVYPLFSTYSGGIKLTF